MNRGDTHLKSFFNAIEEGALEKVMVLLKENPDFVFSNAGGMTPLHWAAKWCHSGVAAFLLTKRAVVNAKNNANGYTPLHVAAFEGHGDMAKVFLANKADVDAKDHMGWTPLRAAGGRTHMAELLRRHRGHE
jgi:ankyrin repeat protein